MWMWHTGWGWLWMSLVMIAFWGLVAWVVVTLVRQSGRQPRDPDAQSLLDERLARGEIDEEDYRRRRDLIRR